MLVPHALTVTLLVLVTSGYVASDTFTSPNYPGLYPPGSKLAKSFAFGAGLRPRVVLKTLSLNGTDSVSIAEGSVLGTVCNRSSEIKRYSGVNKPKDDTVFSVGSEVCILFDGTKGNGKGFEFFIEGIPTCGGKYQDVEESDIISPRYTEYYLWNNNCTWQVIVPAGQHISFQVYAFDLEPGCSNAYITISNIKDFSSTKKLCDKEIANKVIESLGSSDVYFWSRGKKWWESELIWDYYLGSPGFRLQFTILGCKQDDLPTTAEYGTQTNPQPLYNERYVAKFHCDDGYKYSNDLEELALTCESDKKWHQVAEAPWPTCVQIKCPRPGGPHYGSVKFYSEVIGSKAIYTCDANFNLVGESVRVCQNDGTWNGTKPVCQFVGSIGCQEIGDPAFGQVIGNGSSTNSVLAFECNKGYTLNGPANITCHADGIWSGRIPTCDVVRCPVLTAPLNGNVQTAPLNGNINPVYQTVVTYTCSNGYRLVNSTDGKRECLETELWSGPEPSCEVITCPRPNIHGGNVTYDSLMIGGQANFTCDKGREITAGDTTAVCLPTGEWSVYFMPMCFRVRCPPLVNLTNADADWVGTSYGNEVTVECRPGFFFDEERSVNEMETRCTETKEWSGNASQGCFFAPVPTTPPVTPVITTPTVVETPTGTPTPTGTLTPTALPQTTKTTPITKLPTTTTPPTTSLESTPTSAAVKKVTTSQPATDDLVTTSATNTTAQPSSTGKVFTVEASSTAAVTSGRLTPTGTAATTARSTTAGTAETATTEKSDEISTAEVSPTHNFTAKEPSTTAAIQLSTAAVSEISTVNAGNSSLNLAESGEYIGIGVGCALLVIVLVVVALYFKKFNEVASERLANVDENGQGAFENQLYDLDSVNVTLGDNERAIDVHQSSFNN